MRNLTASLIVTLILAVTGLAGSRTVGVQQESDDFNKVTTTTVKYAIPDVRLVRADGQDVSLREELNDGRPVVMSFIFTTCTTICPLSSSTFQKLQSKLGADRKRVHMVSISIDPEEDTPERLTEYAKTYEAGQGWSFYTGAVEAIIDTQRAFGVYRGDKMNHPPVTLMRAAPGQPWIRIDGFATPDELLKRVRSMVAEAGY